jgi:plastocyanin
VSERGPRRRSRALAHLLSVALAGTALLLAGSALAAEPTIEAAGLSWSPPTASVGPGEKAKFKNSTATLHALTWESGPQTPGCTGVPTTGQANWEGTCTFQQAGSYKFYCPIHPVQMKGTIEVSGPPAPTASTGAATGVSETSATLNGSVNPSGQPTTYYFEYGTSTAYGSKTTESSAGEGTAAVPKSAAVTGLAPGLTYHFRIVAKYASGTAPGADRTFTTIGPPSATTETATKVTSTEATLAGAVTPNGLATTYLFKWGTTAAYGQETAAKAVGSGTVAVTASALLSGLAPQTTYHFQLIATNSAGTTSGADRTFTTGAVPPFDPPDDPPPGLDPPPLIPPAPITPPAGPGPAPPPPAPSAPDTRITLKPAAKTRDRTPMLKFAATVPGATYRCSIDGKSFKPCASPFTTPSLKPGRHSLRVAAVSGGAVDPTPASCSFKVLAKKKRR